MMVIFRLVTAMLLVFLTCSCVIANDIFQEAAEVTEAALVVGTQSMNRLDEIEIGPKNFETKSSLNERMLAAKRIAALLFFPAVPIVARRRQLTDDPLDRSEFPCKVALVHFGNVFTAQEAQGIAVTGNANPALDLPGTGCLVDMTTHLEGLRIESHNPIRQKQLAEIIRATKRHLEYDKKTHVAYASYPIPYPMKTEEFDAGVQEPYKGLPERLHRVGGELIAILNDPTKPDPDRILAAKWLGRMKYVIAIPALIDQIDLESPGGSDDQLPKPDPIRFPCVAALAEFRSGASIDIAKRISRLTSVTEATRWKHNIWSDDALRGVITHLRGMAFEETDPTQRSRLLSFIRVLYADGTDAPSLWSMLLPCIAILFAFVGGWVLGKRASRVAAVSVSTIGSGESPVSSPE